LKNPSVSFFQGRRLFGSVGVGVGRWFFLWYWSVEIVGAKLSKAMKKDKKTRGLGGHCWWWGGPETGKGEQCRRIIFEIQRKRRCRCDRKNDGWRDTLKPPLGVTFGMQDNHPRMQGSRGSMVSRGIVAG
jgi:hypothetical protein